MKVRRQASASTPNSSHLSTSSNGQASTTSDGQVSTTDSTNATDLLDSGVCAPSSNFSQSDSEVLSDGSHVVCDRQTDGGHWVVIQRRTSETVDFYQGWDNYTEGFGDLQGNFWLGLETIHRLCNKRPCQLRFDLTDNNTHYFAQYADFRVASAQHNYRVNFGAESGTTTDGGKAFSWNNNMEFTTYDRDNDKSNVVNCAQSYQGGWWYNSCTYVNPNGGWGRNSYSGVGWNPITFSWINGRHSLSGVEMKVRRQASASTPNSGHLSTSSNGQASTTSNGQVSTTSDGQVSTTDSTNATDLLDSDVCALSSNSSQSEFEVLSDGSHVVCDRQTDGGHWVVIQRELQSQSTSTKDGTIILKVSAICKETFGWA